MTAPLWLVFACRALGCAAAAATVPLITELLLLTPASFSWRERRQKTQAPEEIQLLPTTAVVPAHNEAALITRCVDSLLSAAPERFRVLVVAHNCSDNTGALARAAGAEVLCLDDKDRSGKGHALLAGFDHALKEGAQALVVMDADSVALPGFSRACQSFLSQTGGAFQSRYVVRDATAHARTRIGAIAFQGFNVIRPRGRAALGLSAGLFGNGFGFTADVLSRVPYSAMSIVEDLEYHLQLVRAGMRVRFLEQAAVGSEMPGGSASGQSQKQRWEGGRFLMARVWAPRLLKQILGGQWRLIEPLLELLSLPLALAVAALSFAFGVALLGAWLPLFVYSGCALLVVAVHVIAASSEQGGLGEAVRTWLSVPSYILWKLRILPGTLLASRRSAAWVRTERELVAQPRPVGAPASADSLLTERT